MQLHYVSSERVCLLQCIVICFRMYRPIASVFWKLNGTTGREWYGWINSDWTMKYIYNGPWNSNLVDLLRLRSLLAFAVQKDVKLKRRSMEHYYFKLYVLTKRMLHCACDFFFCEMSNKAIYNQFKFCLHLTYLLRFKPSLKC